MYTIRRIDLIGQAVIGILSLLTFSLYIIAAGELVLGIWQLISAACNSSAMLQTTHRSRIKLYWILVLAVVVMLIIPVTAVNAFAVIISWGIAVYYWFIYRSFLNYLSFRKELSTIVRHH